MWLDANIWPAARDAEEIFWQIIIFQTFPVQGRRRHWGLWQSCDEALSHQNQNHSTYFPRNIISAESQLKFVSVRDSDLFAVQLWICSVWPKLYFPDIVVCICVCCSHPWFIAHLFLVLSNVVKAVDLLSRCTTLTLLDVMWMRCGHRPLMRICELWRDVDFLPISVAMTWR